jgi:phage FluMu protein Com
MVAILCRNCRKVCYSSALPKEHLSPYCPRCGADLREAGEVLGETSQPSKRDDRPASQRSEPRA